MADYNHIGMIGIVKGNIEPVQDGCIFILETDRAFSKESKLVQFKCAAFKKTAEVIIKYCKDNSKLCVEGSLEMGNNGPYINVRNIDFLGKGFKKEEKQNEYTNTL
jgi:hypothetical protein